MNAICNLIAEKVTVKAHTIRKFKYVTVHIKTSLPQLLRPERYSELSDQGVLRTHLDLVSIWCIFKNPIVLKASCTSTACCAVTALLDLLNEQSFIIQNTEQQSKFVTGIFVSKRDAQISLKASSEQNSSDSFERISKVFWSETDCKVFRFPAYKLF